MGKIELAEYLVGLIYDFNEAAGLLDKGYNAQLEASFQVEEALEGLNLVSVADAVGYELEPGADDLDARWLAKHILYNNAEDKLDPADAVDKACDAVIYAIGSMAKLGLSRMQTLACLITVAECNMLKISNKIMAGDGKLLKPVGFKGPEDRIRQIIETSE